MTNKTTSANDLVEETALERLKRRTRGKSHGFVTISITDADAILFRSTEAADTITRLQAALTYARNLIGPDEIIDAALSVGGE